MLDDAIIEEINSSGQKNVGYVYSPEGQLLARQSGNQVTWKHTTPGGTGQYDTLANGSYFRVELDPMGADIGTAAPEPPDIGGGEGDIGGNHSGGIMDSRWANFFDVSGGCSSLGYTAACHGVTSPEGYLQAQMRSFFGDQWFDLPGNNNEREQGEAAYERMLSKAFAAYAERKNSQKKPKLKKAKRPPRHQTPEEKRKRDEENQRELAKKGNSEDDQHPNIHQVDFNWLINQHLTIENFTPQQESWIRYELEPMLTDQCSQAFPAGVNSPTRTILESGLTIRPAQDLYYRTAKDLNLSERSRTDAIKQVFGTTGIVQGGTTFGLDGGVQIYLHDQAFQGETWWPGYLSLGEVLRHESIHGGGQPPIPYLFGHDLKRWKYYKQIMQACSRN